MSRPSPAISVILPVFNERPSFLQKAIKSILQQTFTDLELLLVNDGSTENACLTVLEAAREEDQRVRLINLKSRQGITAALNEGLKQSQAPFVARMDSDDFSLPGRLETQLLFMEGNPACALCGTFSEIINEAGQVIGRKSYYSDYAKIKTNILKFNFFTHSTLFFRKSILDKFKGYSNQFPLNEDYDLLLKVIAKNKAEIIPQYLTQYRFNPQSLTQKNNKEQEKNGLKLRLHALRNYGYPWYSCFKLLPAFLLYLFIPASLKNQLKRRYEKK